MRLIKFVPRVCTEHEAKDPQTLEPVKGPDGSPVMQKPTFEGFIMLKCPSFDERMAMLESLGLRASSKGEVDTDGVDGIQLIRKLVKASEQFYESVQLKRLEDGVEFESFEDLSYDEGCALILSDVGYALRGGFRPGKS
jgi:hypothetical protein